MRAYFELYPQPLQVNNDGQRRSCLIKEVSASGESTEQELYFWYPAGLPMPDDEDCDSYLLAALLPAMKLNAVIIVHGSASKQLLANLAELQHVWRKWCPDLYFSAEIKVENIREDETPSAGAVVAFSGGADAQFSAYRHATGKAGYATQSLLAGVLVHGFDIPLTDHKGFTGAAKKAKDALDNLDLNFIPIKTNASRIWDVNWEHHCAMALVSVLCGLKNYAGIGLIGSGEPYDALLEPWGSHPIIDPLMSSGSFRIIHDGAGFNRSEKIKLISNWAVGIKNLRVCWAGDKKDSNCGVCEKCLRTRLNFLLAGVSNPTCFTTTLTKNSFNSIFLGSDAARAEWLLIRNDILKSGIGLQWLPQIDKVLNKKNNTKLGWLLPSGSRRRAFFKNVYNKFSGRFG